MYCGVDEAYNNNNNNPNQLGGFDNYSDIDIQNHFVNNYKQYNSIVPAYFTAQGDISKQKNGTSINDLKNVQDTESLFSSESDFTLDSNSTKKQSDSDSFLSERDIKSVKKEKPCDCCNNKVQENFTDNLNIKEYFDIENLGYSLKELLIIILAGIVLIFILDLFVKIGKKMSK